MCLKQKRPLPKAIANAPELNLGLEFVYSSFWELSTTRPTGWGFGPIPWNAIASFCDRYEMDDEESEDFSFLSRAMDRAFLEHHAEKDKNKTPQSPAAK